MSAKDKREVWLRGPLPNMPSLLQPVAHALLQAREEVETLMSDFPEDKLWEKPVGVASPGFHLQHLSGVLDRLFTYAKGELLSELQMQSLAKEGQPSEETKALLIENFRAQVDKALEQLRSTSETQLTQPRGVGRSQIPSTVIGLYTHAAEHTMRHLGQLLVTVRVLRGS
jgi:hypothetical protein